MTTNDNRYFQCRIVSYNSVTIHPACNTEASQPTYSPPCLSDTDILVQQRVAAGMVADLIMGWGIFAAGAWSRGSTYILLPVTSCKGLRCGSLRRASGCCWWSGAALGARRPPIQAIWLYSATARAGPQTRLVSYSKKKIRKRVGGTNGHKAMLESHHSRVRKRS